MRPLRSKDERRLSGNPSRARLQARVLHVDPVLQ